MPSTPPTVADELREAVRLAVEATVNVTGVVQDMHVAIGAGPEVLHRPLEKMVKLVTAPVYATIKGVTTLVGAGLDLALEQLGPLLGESTPGPERELLVAALNGVVGDTLAQTNSALATRTQFRRLGKALVLERSALTEAIPEATDRLLVMVHGSCANETCWQRRGHDHGALLEAELGLTAVALRYNSGLHISENGELFSAALEQLVQAWPVPVKQVVIVAHSMGGLVTRAACHLAEKKGHAWRRAVESVVFLGTPHQGAPLERGGNWLEALFGVSRMSAPLARLAQLRSAGVTDLRYGLFLEEHWKGHDRFALEHDPRCAQSLPDGVACFAVAASTSAQGTENPLGDGLVPVASALGRHDDPKLHLGFGEAHQRLVFGLNHLDLLSDSDVGRHLVDWLRSASGAKSP